MKKPEKNRKKSENSIFSVFLTYFSKSPRYIENFKKKQITLVYRKLFKREITPVYHFFLHFVPFFLDFLFSTYHGDFAKKRNKVRKKEVFLLIKGQFFEKTSLGHLRKNRYIPEKMKKNSEKTRLFSLFFVNKKPY